MRNTNKKGFTIVELVIVVAVIAILAAVLIPTFSGIIRKANESKDTQLVKHLNTAIAADVNGDKTMSAAIAAAAEFGFDLSKIDAKVEGNEILWDSVANVFCYLNDGTVEYLGEVANKGAGAQLWIIDTDGDDKTHDTYSSYVANVEAARNGSAGARRSSRSPSISVRGSCRAQGSLTFYRRSAGSDGPVFHFQPLK